MSSAFYSTRMTWDCQSHVGLAKTQGVIVDLRVAFPQSALPGVHVAELEYIPEIRQFDIRESGRAWRKLTGAERDLISAFLNRMASAAHAEIERSL